jgi:hypothetical protein
MAVNFSFSFITCGCGKEFQVINADETDWDEIATAQEYYEHLEVCPLNKE